MENTTQTIATIGEQTDVLEKIVGKKTIIPSIIIATLLLAITGNEYAIFYAFAMGGIFFGISLVKQKINLILLSVFHILLPITIPALIWLIWLIIIIIFTP